MLTLTKDGLEIVRWESDASMVVWMDEVGREHYSALLRNVHGCAYFLDADGRRQYVQDFVYKNGADTNRLVNA